MLIDILLGLTLVVFIFLTVKMFTTLNDDVDNLRTDIRYQARDLENDRALLYYLVDQVSGSYYIKNKSVQSFKPVRDGYRNVHRYMPCRIRALIEQDVTLFRTREEAEAALKCINKCLNKKKGKKND